MVDISLLLPTRGRPSLVYRLFDSIVETTSNPKRLEVVLYLDEDDLKSQKISHSILPITKLIGPSISMGSLNSACYRASKGSYVMILNPLHNKDFT